MWSDSHTVLQWVNSNGRYKQFEDYRVKEINSFLPSSKWKYCQTKENPTDLGTRRKTPRELIESDLWCYGSDWLGREQWPKEPFILWTEKARAEEVKSVMHVQPSINSIFRLWSKIEVEKFSKI